jgi:hypothetical protein
VSFSTRPLYPEFTRFDPFHGEHSHYFASKYEHYESVAIDLLNRCFRPGTKWRVNAKHYAAMGSSKSVSDLYCDMAVYAYASTIYDADVSIYQACCILEYVMPIDDVCLLTRFKSKRPKPGYVYLVECDGMHKIGITNDPTRRIGEFNTMYHKPVNVITVSQRVPDMVAIEWLLHGMYHDFRVRGEWFNLSESQVLTIDDFLTGGAA